MLPRAFYVGTFKDLEDLNNKRSDLKDRVKKIYDDNIEIKVQNTQDRYTLQVVGLMRILNCVNIIRTGPKNLKY